MATEINYNNLSSILDGLRKVTALQTIGATTNIPSTIIGVGGANKPGLSPTTIADNIIQQQDKAGIPIGPLPNGEESANEIMIRIIVKEIVRAIQEDASIQIAIPPGITITGTGGNAGGPVQIFGSTIGGFRKAYGQII